jgi:hypothetical protein
VGAFVYLRKVFYGCLVGGWLQQQLPVAASLAATTSPGERSEEA